jgi:hypothetical protein
LIGYIGYRVKMARHCSRTFKAAAEHGGTYVMELEAADLSRHSASQWDRPRAATERPLDLHLGSIGRNKFSMDHRL